MLVGSSGKETEEVATLTNYDPPEFFSSFILLPCRSLVFVVIPSPIKMILLCDENVLADLKA